MPDAGTSRLAAFTAGDGSALFKVKASDGLNLQLLI